MPNDSASRAITAARTLVILTGDCRSIISELAGIRSAGIALHQPCQMPGRMDVDIRPEIGDPTLHGQPEADQLPGAARQGQLVPVEMFFQPDVGQHGLQAAAEPAEKLADRPAVGRQRDDRIDGQLAGAVQDRAAATIDPPQLDLAAGQLGRRCPQVCPRPQAADA